MQVEGRRFGSRQELDLLFIIRFRRRDQMMCSAFFIHFFERAPDCRSSFHRDRLVVVGLIRLADNAMV